MEMFKHETLDTSNPQIRLIHLVQEEDGTVNFRVEVHDFDEHLPPYNALSYTWGPPLPTREILVNKKSFVVRENLCWFLECMQRGRWTHVTDKTTFPLRNIAVPTMLLWVDQLCINQSEPSEKIIKLHCWAKSLLEPIPLLRGLEGNTMRTTIGLPSHILHRLTSSGMMPLSRS
jgi:hypothetical protein